MENKSNHYSDILDDIKNKGLFKNERIISSPQGIGITTIEGRKVLNFCANNYLGLSNHPDLISSAIKGLKDYGFGMASVRFICAAAVAKLTASIDKQKKGMEELEAKIEATKAAFKTLEDDAFEVTKPCEMCREALHMHPP